ncbi:MAG: hypothetical protein P8Z35_14960 [Ignavibacteriaceae bacterium]
MKFFKTFFTYIFLVLLVGTLKAQSADTVVVPATNSDGTPYFDSIIDYVVADTNSDGSQKHMTYRLERGGWQHFHRKFVHYICRYYTKKSLAQRH